jgi:uncharacterized protein
MTQHPPKPGDTTIEISSGDYLDLANPDPKMITIDVVAHHLSQENRYGGAPRRPLSVGEHTILVASYLHHNNYTPEIVLAGLHHDDPEAFLKDIPRPLKEMLRSLYRPIEMRMELAIAQAFDFENFGVDIHHPAVVKADNWALSAEAWFHMRTQGKEWWCAGLYEKNSHVNPPMIMSPTYRVGMNIRDVERHWKVMHSELVHQIVERIAEGEDIGA